MGKLDVARFVLAGIIAGAAVAGIVARYAGLPDDPSQTVGAFGGALTVALLKFVHVL